MGKKKKYHMIKWDALNKPKEFRGLGFINTSAMNIALLSRWISRIESEEESPCRRLLRKKNIWVMVVSFKGRTETAHSSGKIG